MGNHAKRERANRLARLNEATEAARKLAEAQAVFRAALSRFNVAIDTLDCRIFTARGGDWHLIRPLVVEMLGDYARGRNGDPLGGRRAEHAEMLGKWVDVGNLEPKWRDRR